jgi:hypothetical protein
MENMIECIICTKQCKGQISGSHLKTHGLSKIQYEAIYGPSQHPAFKEMLILAGKKGGSSPASVAAHHAARENRKANFEKSCKECSAPIPYEKGSRQKYCSSSCSAISQNRKKSERVRATQRYRCDHCDAPLGQPGKYCNHVCQNTHLQNKLIAEWRDGVVRGGSDVKLSSTIRLYLIEQANHACTLCGWDKINSKTGNCPLHIDHVNGDCTDHRPKNLRVICPNCHSLTETYGALNRDNKGRTVRRKERIANGLSHDQAR